MNHARYMQGVHACKIIVHYIFVMPVIYRTFVSNSLQTYMIHTHDTLLTAFNIHTLAKACTM